MLSIEYPQWDLCYYYFGLWKQKDHPNTENKGYDAGKKVSGIKHHIAVDTKGLPHAVHIKTANVTDREGALETFKKGIEHPDPAICINVIMGLIKITNYLLDHQIQHLERKFLQEGGLRERMTRARINSRGF